MIRVGDIVKMVDFKDFEEYTVYKNRIAECIALRDEDMTVNFISNPALIQYYRKYYALEIDEMNNDTIKETFYAFRFVKWK